MGNNRLKHPRTENTRLYMDDLGLPRHLNESRDDHAVVILEGAGSLAALQPVPEKVSASPRLLLPVSHIPGRRARSKFRLFARLLPHTLCLGVKTRSRRITPRHFASSVETSPPIHHPETSRVHMHEAEEPTCEDESVLIYISYPSRPTHDTEQKTLAFCTMLSAAP